MEIPRLQRLQNLALTILLLEHGSEFFREFKFNPNAAQARAIGLYEAIAAARNPSS